MIRDGGGIDLHPLSDEDPAQDETDDKSGQDAAGEREPGEMLH